MRFVYRQVFRLTIYGCRGRKYYFGNTRLTCSIEDIYRSGNVLCRVFFWLDHGFACSLCGGKMYYCVESMLHYRNKPGIIQNIALIEIIIRKEILFCAGRKVICDADLIAIVSKHSCNMTPNVTCSTDH